MGNMDNLDIILEEILISAYSKIITCEEKVLKNIGELGLKEFHTLDTIASTTKNKTNTANNIASILNITPGTLTTNLDRLISKGYISKEKDENDKRQVKILLTSSGINIRRKRELAHKKIINSALAHLSTTEKVALVNALNKIEF